MLDLGIDLNAWPWVWLSVAVFFAIIELTVLAGSFVLLPFAVSAFAASLLAFYDAPIEAQWFTFVFGGAALWILAYRWARKFVDDNAMEPGVGAERLVGLTGIVTTSIDPDDTERRGRVTVHGEVWGATSQDGIPLGEGAKVRITQVTGTRVMVEPLAADGQSGPPTGPPTSPPSPPN